MTPMPLRTATTVTFFYALGYPIGNLAVHALSPMAVLAFRFGLAREFFQGFTNEARCNLHVELLYGDEPHHIVEALFKAFARATDTACRRDPRIAGQLPSTKGKL